MKHREVTDLVGGLAASQWGMFTTAQASALGVTRVEIARLAGMEIVRRVRHGVYVMAGAPSDAFEDARAEWLATSPQRTAGERRDDDVPVIVSDETAAGIYGVGDLTAGGVHLTSTRRLRSRQAWVTIHQRQIGPKEYQLVNGLPVTTPRRTLEDLAGSGRWEHSQLLDLVHDAINQGLIPRVDIVRSKVLAQVVPELAQPASHAAVRQRLANDARRRGIDPREAYNTFFRMMFTGALMEDDSWVLKGGTNLFCRLRDARSTLDLDLFRDGDTTVTATVTALREVMEGRTVGRYSFRLGKADAGAGEEIDVSRLRVTVVDGITEVESFNIDLSTDIVLNAEPELVTVSRGDDAVVPGYPSTITVRLYPVENQMADKVCAMYSSFGSGTSTRFRDLYDLAMIADQLTFDPVVLAEALRTQEAIRRMVLPDRIVEPAPGWREAYEKQMRKTSGTRPPFTEFDSAIALVRTSVEPFLPAKTAPGLIRLRATQELTDQSVGEGSGPAS